MATEVTPGEKFNMLSLTGRLSLQEKNPRKNRKGKITFKKKSSHWFWFDEKECYLKYYKNSETYYSHLHKYEGWIDLKNAKVSPSEVYQDSVGSVSIDTDVVSNKTFIIFTSDANMYALTADKDHVCHEWIKKLQEKRANWDKNSTRKKLNQPKEEFLNMKEEGLVHCTGDTKLASSKSHVQTIFENILGGDGPRRESCPNTLPIMISHQGTDSNPYSRTYSSSLIQNNSPYPHNSTCSLSTMSNDLTDGDHDRSASCDSSIYVGGRSYDETKTLTDSERNNLQMQVQLFETHQENEKLLQKIAFLEDEKQKQYEQKMELINEIQDLLETVHKLKATTPVKDLQNENENLKDVIKKLKRSLGSVDGEVELYKVQLEERNKRIQEANRKLREAEDNLLYYKAKYISLLDWSFKIPTPGPGGSSSDDTDPIEEKLKEDLLNLINEESSADNPLVDIVGDQSIFEDQYGELHDWRNDSNMCHFLCRQLYLHYTQYDQDLTTQEWYNYTKSLKLNKDGYFDIPSDSHRSKRRELRGYLRKGVPQPMRSTMWASLVYSYVGKTKDVMNSTAPGKNYYQSLLHTQSFYHKQILLDLYRTMPSNKHYKLDGTGAKKLERVLLAYSNHNKNIGYCQGMNMIAAAGLLFLDEESAFWFLITVIEKLMPLHYYTTGLAAAQADQAVMKKLVEEKLPNLSNHLEVNEIDVTVVTFNWFLTLFIDALPTESILRVMDCFLLEGRKIFFRFSLAIFKIHELRILRLHDPVTIFQFVKEVAKHIFNVEELFKIAFTELEPFPSRSNIQSRIKPHLERFLADWKVRESFKKSTPSVPVNVSLLKQKKQLLWECGVIISPDEVWLCCGERQTGKICIIKSIEDSLEINSPNINVGSKILCIKVLPDDVVMVGTLDFYIRSFCTKTRTELWSMKMNDSVLDFVCYENNIICALADGYIAALITTTPRDPPTVDPILYRIGNIAVQCMTISPFNHVWVGCGKAITILEAKTYDPVQAIILPEKAGKVYKMEPSDKGVWVTFKTSTLLYLYDYEHMVDLLAVDYMSLLPPKPDTKLHLSNIDNRITALMIFKDMVWIGTGSASFHVFKLSSTVAKPEEQAKQIARLKELRNSGHFENKTSQYNSLPRGDLSNDEGLLNEKKVLLTTTSSNDQLQTSNRRQEEMDDEGELDNNPSRLKRREFGKTFYRRIRKEASSVDLKDGLYELGHLWSRRLDHDVKECPKITTIKPIITQNDKCVVVSCMNTTTKFDKAVQLWRYDGKESHNWSCKYLYDCYSVVMKEGKAKPRPPTIDSRRRSYSTFLGSCNMSELQPIPQTPSTLIIEEPSD